MAAGRFAVNRRRIRLEAVGPLFAGQSWQSASLMLVGRVGGLDVSLPHPSVSRHHAEVAPVESGWVVRDLGSTNRPLRNDVRTGQAGRPLRHGDALRFGQVGGTVALGTRRRRAERANGLTAAAALDVPGDIVIQTVTALAQAVELRDRYTGGHTQRVTN